MEEVYRIVVDEGEGFLEEKRSKFLSVVFAVENEEEALQRINQIRKKHWDARHHVFAYVIGERDEIVRASDDGEPSGTGGKPVLDVLKGAGLHNVCLVVTRYFGGTLLGTGGLIRAYGGAAKDAVENAGISEKMKGIMAETVVEYTDLGKLEYLLRENQVTTLDTGYTDKVELTLLIPAKDESRIRELLTEESGGRITLGEGMEVAYIETKNGPKVL